MYKSQAKLGEVLDRMAQRLSDKEMRLVDECFAAGKWQVGVSTDGERCGAEIRCTAIDLGEVAGGIFDRLAG